MHRFLLATLVTALCAQAALAQNSVVATMRKPAEIRIDDVTAETQPKTKKEVERLELVWYIPHAFWQATFAKDASIPQEAQDQLSKMLEPYFLVAVVQGEITPFGSTKFYPRETVSNHLKIEYLDRDGRARQLMPLPQDQIQDDMKMLLEQLKPVLAGMIGNMGQNIHFFVFNASEGGVKIADPLSRGELQISTLDQAGANPANYAIQLPLNSLIQPRKCPGGQDAHVSWQFCPWTGEKLPEMRFED